MEESRREGRACTGLETAQQLRVVSSCSRGAKARPQRPSGQYTHACNSSSRESKPFSVDTGACMHTDVHTHKHRVDTGGDDCYRINL